MGTLDRWIRILLAVLMGLLILIGTLTGTWAVILGIVALLFLVTSLIGFCPLYTILGIRTRKD